ncbi:MULTISPECIES: hypothetical protein [Rhizobium/Agrobacterium group]|uniref:hypothetical protein n=1 Tax=Rhizobium/Agrobacterium group TaxID=227290 RepID=UPI00107F5E30|nr:MULTISPECIES: hypothetical protein [Rhizobium/Agrobacterium group]MBB4401994.1 hypothetical protein [Agrobacterium radiobacter]MBB5587400.1 hypothetical protein [Agrobacterium radiobacter]TGE90120.1 hypothetical protein C9418_06950 [Rhizobium sp. SEMIA 4032]
MATYKQIQSWVKEQYDFVPKTCWIADVKAGYGKTSRVASNRIDSSDRKYPCPEERREAIETALRHFSII